MGELLLELLSEEIPARMQRRAIEDLAGLIRDKLAAAEIPATTVTGCVTPRRMAVIADGIPATQPDRSEERRGPRVGAPEAAIGGFLRAAGLASIDQCEKRATDRGEFYFAVIRQQGRISAAVLPGIVMEAITALPWPKSMRFPASTLRWVRPLNSAICLFDGAVVPLALGDVPVGRVTRGHRFLSAGEISVANAADYLDKLGKAYVVLDRGRRRQIIADGLGERAAAEGLTVKPDEGLLDEVTGLVEYPVVLAGTIDPVFMDLPPEVLATAMRTHQKYFWCLNADRTPAPRFLFVANNRTEDGGAAIAAGNERVLRARLSDARFFWDQDRKIRLEARVGALKDRVFHAKLGSVYDKVVRIETLTEYLADHIGAAEAGTTGPLAPFRQDHPGGRDLARLAARLCKADLSTGMVGEFPELQGVMGRYYALNNEVGHPVADAIADHYKPLGPSDACPTAPITVVVALADKIDTLTAFFAIGEKPTGSRDPFALRRAALGIIRIILEHKPWPLRLPLLGAFEFSRQLLDPSGSEVSGELLVFLIDRLRVHLRGEGFRHDLITAALSRAGEREDDLALLFERVTTLRGFAELEVGKNLLAAFRRASNIVAIEERKDRRKYDGEVLPAHLQQLEEKRLFEELQEADTFVKRELERDVLSLAYERLSRLRQPVDEFFDRVTVNVDDTALRENRLRLLSRIRATMNQVADFSQIEG